MGAHHIHMSLGGSDNVRVPDQVIRVNYCTILLHTYVLISVWLSLRLLSSLCISVVSCITNSRIFLVVGSRNYRVVGFFDFVRSTCLIRMQSVHFHFVSVFTSN